MKCEVYYTIDINECDAVYGLCDVDANCTNMPGSYECTTCRDGFTGDGLFCEGKPMRR